MKKFYALILAIFIAASACACDNRDAEEDVSTASELSAESVTDETSDISAEASDESVGEPFEMSELVSKINSFFKYDVDTSLKANNIFEGMKYSYSTPPTEAYPDDSFTKLTDSVIRDLFDKWNWVGFNGSNTIDITFDLGEHDHKIAVVEYDALRQLSYGIKLPDSVSLAVSDDGIDYTVIAEIVTPGDLPESSKYLYRFALSKAISPRYIRLSAYRPQGGFLFVDEISAFEYDENGKYDIGSGQTVVPDDGIIDYYGYNINSDVTVPVSPSDGDYDTFQNLAALDGTDVQIYNFDAVKSTADNTSAENKGMLTDGITTSAADYRKSEWFRFARGYGRHIVVDLGNVMAVSALKASFLNQVSVGIAVPPVVNVSISTDADNWITVYGNTTIPYGDKGNTCVYNLDADFGGEYKARYVRLSFCTVPSNSVSCMVYLSEVEVWGKKNTSLAAEATYNGSLVYGNYPDPERYGVGNILLAAVGNLDSGKSMTEKKAMVYYGKHDENGEITDIFFDSFCFSPTVSFAKTGDIETDSKRFIDTLFADGVNLAALDSGVAKVNAALGTENKPTYWISLYCMGRDATSVDSLYNALALQVDYALDKVENAGFDNIRLAGFYYNDEYIPDSVEEITVEALARLNDYLHSKGLLSLWCPYYNAYGIWRWHDAGFDIACLQPNYMFYSTEATRLATCAQTAKIYGMCVELEIEDNVSEGACALYGEYLAEGVKSGYMNSVQLYYEGSVGGAIYSAYGALSNTTRMIYENTYLYAKHCYTVENGSADGSIDAVPDTVDITVKNGRREYFDISDLSQLDCRFVCVPVYGKICVNQNGRCRYDAMKGYCGGDTVIIEVYDAVGNMKTVTVNVTVTE